MSQARVLDPDLWMSIEEIADLPTSTETPGVAKDHEMDVMIMMAREICRQQDQAIRDHNPAILHDSREDATNG